MPYFGRSLSEGVKKVRFSLESKNLYKKTGSKRTGFIITSLPYLIAIIPITTQCCLYLGCELGLYLRIGFPSYDFVFVYLEKSEI